jgi:AGCS family alanine or glycine:cation symporter
LLFHLRSLAWRAALPLLLISGVWLTWRSRGFALRHTVRAMGWVLRGSEQQGDTKSGVSPFSCLCTALASTVGTGNLAGVAVALTTGGPGALVWMWISAALGCSLKYAECALAVAHRRSDKKGGAPLGGSMVTLTCLPWPRLGLFLGTAYAAIEAAFALGAGSLVQSSAIAEALSAWCGLPKLWVAVALAALTLAVLSGGAASISRCCAALVPGMIALYVLGGVAVLLRFPQETLSALGLMLRQALCPASVSSGVFGDLVRIGVQRGCFSHESGTGNAGFSAALTSADPVRQGLISATANLWDTGILCSITALTILATGAMDTGRTGVALTMAAYQIGLGQAGEWIVGCCLVLFAFSSLPGLAFQGEQALRFLWDRPSLRRAYRLLFAGMTGVGCLVGCQAALAAADLGNALLIPLNLLPLWVLHIPQGTENWADSGARAKKQVFFRRRCAKIKGKERSPRRYTSHYESDL